MTPGAAVWYRQALRGGYGYIVNVPAVFVSGPTLKGRVRIRVELKSGGTKEISVKAANVRPREETK